MSIKASKFKTVSECIKVDDMSSTKLIQYNSCKAFKRSKTELVTKCKENFSKSINESIKKVLNKITEKGSIFIFLLLNFF